MNKANYVLLFPFDQNIIYGICLPLASLCHLQTVHSIRPENLNISFKSLRKLALDTTEFENKMIIRYTKQFRNMKAKFV